MKYLLLVLCLVCLSGCSHGTEKECEDLFESLNGNKDYKVIKAWEERIYYIPETDTAYGCWVGMATRLHQLKIITRKMEKKHVCNGRKR